jgi:YD repeat-containing protein
VLRRPDCPIAGDVTTATDARGDSVSYTYDQLGRKLTETVGTTPGSGTRLASWSYDSAAGGKDQLASSTSYAGGAPYTESVTGYNALYQSLGQSVTIPATSQGLPADEAKLSGTYTTSNTYTANTSLPSSTSYGADGGMPAETVSNTYTQNGILDNVASDTTGATYLAAVSVDQWGRTTRYTLGNTPDQFVQTNYPDLSTGRITKQVLDKQTAAAHVDDITTRWNTAGLITAVSDTQDGAATDLQCCQYNTQGQLTQAWTDTAGTTQQPSPLVPACSTRPRRTCSSRGPTWPCWAV